jgi:putative ABC transport system permease protein
VLAIGLGIGASMTMITVLHVMTDDPLPGYSDQLYYPHIDPLPANFRNNQYGSDPSKNFSWPDALALIGARRAERQAAMAGGTVLMRPTRLNQRPFRADGRYVTSDFFELFGVPFVEGTGWSVQDDDARARVVVISVTLSRRLFGRTDSTGMTVRLGDSDFRVIGVTSKWNPQPKFYADASAKRFGNADQFFLPLSAAMDLKLDIDGSRSGWGPDSTSMTSSTVTWLQIWVQLKDQAQVVAYHHFLVDYSSEQKALGRFQRPPTDAKLFSLKEWLAYENIVPADVRLQLWLALGFLLVCMINISALLLANFQRRSGEVSVRRALGARWRDIFLQLGIESTTVGLAGGGLGLLIAQIGLWSVRQRPEEYARLAHMDYSMLLGTFALAIMASILAGLLPAWRACRIAPALQLKLH